MGYYGANRLPLISDEDKPLPFAPDFAVEVASPSQDAGEMAAKARLYLRGGTRLVWVVWPQSAHIDVWHSDSLTGPAMALVIGQSLDGEDLISCDWCRNAGWTSSSPDRIPPNAALGAAEDAMTFDDLGHVTDVQVNRSQASRPGSVAHCVRL